jgi:hypothetical protein
MKTMLYALLMSLSYYSCTSIHLVKPEQSEYADLNQDLKNEEVTIIKKNRESIFGRIIEITLDSTSWLNSQANILSLRTLHIREITFESTWRGAKDGLYYGFLFGAGFGIAVALLVDKEPSGLDAAAFAPMIGIGAGIGGGVWGLIIGAAMGHTDRYIIEAVTDSTLINKY